jgi:hypothetical protein
MERGPALTQNRKTLKAADFINDSGKEKGKGKPSHSVIHQSISDG